jgi:hypothetical protein
MRDESFYIMKRIPVSTRRVVSVNPKQNRLTRFVVKKLFDWGILSEDIEPIKQFMVDLSQPKKQKIADRIMDMVDAYHFENLIRNREEFVILLGEQEFMECIQSKVIGMPWNTFSVDFGYRGEIVGITVMVNPIMSGIALVPKSIFNG